MKTIQFVDIDVQKVTWNVFITNLSVKQSIVYVETLSKLSHDQYTYCPWVNANKRWV